MRAQSHKRKRRLLPKPVALLLLLLVAALLDSRYRLVTDTFSIVDPALPDAFDGFRVVQLSDLHEREFGKCNARLVAAVAAENPDLIALTGDFIDDAEDMDVTLTLATQLTRLAPVYFISGNHDWATGAMETLRTSLENAGVTVLDNRWELLERGGDTIALCGIEDPNGYADSAEPDAVVRAVHAAYGDCYTLMLAHRNNWLEAYPTLAVNLILCGHGHGGIVRLPGLGGLFGSNETLFPEYSAGLYQSPTYQMLVSRGLGGGMKVPRLLNNPEIVSVTLHNK